MDIIDKLINGLYEQEFYNGTIINPTRFFILHYISSMKSLVHRYDISDISYYVYCLYADNPELAGRHPNVEIRNVLRYGSSPIKQEILNAVKNWNDDSKQSAILCDSCHLWIPFSDDEYSDDLEYLKTVIEEHYKNTFHLDFPILKRADGNDSQISSFGKSAFRNHVLFDMQYCVCCDACNLDDLYAVHILRDEDSTDLTSRDDKENGLIMCSVHAEEYLHGRFSFDPNGKVINHASSYVQKNMRIGIGLLSQKRRKYLEIANKKSGR